MKQFFEEFKQFAMRGNVIDLAIGIIIGVAFNSIVTSLVNDIIMPPIGYILNDIDFSNLFINLSGGDYSSLAAAKDAGAATINYGLFINAVLNFIIVALAVFVLVKQMNRLLKEKPAPPAAPTTKECPFCHTQIPIPAVRCPNCTSHLEESA
ncbi:MAG: large conductance mechanosensitive channel protein MscL [Chloroflexota bacterium]|jgi:large conductance mechanosensitive channel